MKLKAGTHFLPSIIVLITMTICSLTASKLSAAEQDWPREIKAPKATVLMYQPQVETFEGNRLTGRAAVSVTQKGKTEPVFGAVWISARAETNRDTRFVSIQDIDVTRIRFPEATPKQEKQLAAIIEKELPKGDLSIPLDQLLASLDTAKKEQVAADKLKNTPPIIIIVDYPAVLVSLDGDPKLQKIENTGLMRAVNTPFLLVLESKTKKYYLDGGTIWFVADEIKGPWKTSKTPPAEAVAIKRKMDEEARKQGAQDEPEDPDAKKDTRVPKIIVATKSTELIVTDGKPEWTPLAGNELLYLSNTSSDVLLEIASQKYFVVLSGRWYASKSLKGPWSYVPSNRLPASFAKIPPDSKMAHLLVHVGGTKEANEAVLDHAIPQTTAVSRDTKLVVTYDGKPEFEKIEGTDMRYAVNTSFSVIKVKNKYYACHQAVWFTADDPLGPWVVADTIPKEIYTIPPSCPCYNVKYVHIYDSTPEVVYVGYYPGYLGSYVYGETVVYGTGYYYYPWYGTVYYPRPVTWGYHVHYNPWGGWYFGISYSTGPFTFTIGFGGWHRGWWGPGRWRGYHRGYRHGWRRGYRQGYRRGARAGYRAGQNNLYNRPGNKKRNAPGHTPGKRDKAGTARNQRNDVFADKNGNVHRRTDDGWQKREGNEWKSEPRSQERARGSEGRSQLDRDHSSRERGSSRSQQYRGSGQRSSRGGGGHRGGGGRRR